jgi:hypothetical protein
MAYKNRIAGLLTGVSLAALSLMGRGSAIAGQTRSASGTLAFTTNTDFLNIKSPANYTLITNTATISDGFNNPTASEAVAVWVTANAIVKSFVNNGTIQAIEAANTGNGVITAGQVNNTSTSRATATGMRIDGTVGLVTNNGLIQGIAIAHSTTSDATAEAKGIEYDAQGSGIAKVVNNSAGQILATAIATATYTNPDANAEAKAIDMYVTGNPAGGGPAIASVINSGTIGALARATATAYSSAFANAEAVGVEQTIRLAKAAVAVVTNYAGGVIQATAYANAFAEDRASAYATAYGVRQRIEDVPSGTARVINSGDITAKAFAFASSTDDNARAVARAQGVFQSIDAWAGGPGTNGVALVDNNGNIFAGAKATARGFTSASAFATATGVRQHIEDVGKAVQSNYAGAWGLASATVINSGTIKAVASAYATFATNATAEARARGVWQSIDDSVYGIARVVNNASGVILAKAYASATAQGSDARAEADASARGVYQDIDAWVGGPGIHGEAEVINAGQILAFATARAIAAASEGNGRADAWAAATGVRQHVEDVGWPQLSHPDSGIASALVVNSGLIRAYASAYAYATGTANDNRAEADARARGIWQSIDDSPNGSATVINNVGGTIWATAYANAFVTGNWADAEAGARATGVLQTVDAWVGDPGFGLRAQALVVNSGTIGAFARARATSTEDDAEADATAYGVRQRVQDAFDLSAILVNNAGAQIWATAQATANASERAEADALAYGVRQEADEGGNALLIVNNSGYIGAKATALAISTDSEAYASATARGVRQQGEDIDGVFVARVTNDFGAYIGAVAKATASAPGQASATAQATGVRQSAEWTGAASLTVINSGDIGGWAAAKAISTNWSAFANATAHGVFQGGTEDAAISALVTNSVSGRIWAEAKAFASGANNGANANADAFGVLQSANQVLSAKFTVENAGYIGAFAQATAYNAGSFNANANADATGVAQWGGDTLARNFTVNNSGYIGATAIAAAKLTGGSWTANANAEAIGVFQGADNSGAISGLVTNSITGVIYADAKATALVSNAWHANANAFAAGVSQWSGGAAANFTVNNEGWIGAEAAARAQATNARNANADATALGVMQGGENTGAITGLVTNSVSGRIWATAYATALADANSFNANADAYAAGVSQWATDFGAANFTVENAGYIGAKAFADARAAATNFSANAEATAIGVAQYGFGGSDEDGGFSGAFTGSVTNSVGAYIGATANAFALQTGGSNAWARATAYGVLQQVRNTGAVNLTVFNEGYIGAKATAVAVVTDPASAWANANAIGVAQYADEDGVVTGLVTNTFTGYIGATAYAQAVANDDAWNANANAWAAGVSQTANFVGKATYTVDNSGWIEAHARALAVSTRDDAFAFAGAGGVYQSAEIFGSFTASVLNSWYIGAHATATAYANETARANAYAAGVEQGAWDGGVATLSVDNSGYIGAQANAKATGQFANATATANGVGQFFGGVGLPTAVVRNSGVIFATAYAQANGTGTAVARAWAAGINISANNVVTLNVEVDNSGDIYALATAYSNGTAQATAVGIHVFAGLEKTGTIVNSGQIFASAFASAPSGGAQAIGIWDPSAINNMQITNTGLINAYAEVPNSGLYVFATGIRISRTTEDVPAFFFDPTALTTITNDGGIIWAGISDDGGQSFRRGNAINLRGVPDLGILPAPNYTLIELKGTQRPGHIYGDILINEHDRIEVTEGKTFFLGTINSPQDDPRVGTLRIFNGGDLILCQDGWGGACDPGGWGNAGQPGNPFDPQSQTEGPAFVYINTFTVDDGTITYQLTPKSNPGDYSQVFATTANLNAGSTIRAWYLAGFYDDNTFYDNVVQSDTRNGSFDNVVDNSILLVTQQVVDGNNIDLNVDRTPFGAVAGLTQNQKAVGNAIENVYPVIFGTYGVNTDPSTIVGDPFAQIVATLFTIDNLKDYGLALNQLSGAQYAQQLQSVIWSTRMLHQTVNDRMECFVEGAAVTRPPAAGKMPTKAPMRPGEEGCFTPGTWNVWIQGHGAWNNHKGDSEAPGYDENQWGIFGGVDYAPSAHWYAGIAAGYFSSNMKFDPWGGVSGGSIKYDGFQIAGYGGYDNRVWYGRGILAYGGYSGESHRFISINGTPVDPSGKPDASVLSFYGEVGRRFVIAPDQTTLTPFAGLTVAHGEIQGFTETDPQNTGAALRVHTSDGTSVASRLGLRVQGYWKDFSPYASIAWEHEFGDTRQTVGMTLIAAPVGANFNVVSADTAADWAVAQVGAHYALGPMNKITVQYSGWFNGDYTSHGVLGRWTGKF